MIEIKAKNEKKYISYGIILLILGVFMPMLTQPAWVNIVVKIREAINTGDSGHLILASASMCFLCAVQVTFFYLGVMFTLSAFGVEFNKISIKVFFIFILLVSILFIID
jgi:hypothetical protein